MNYLILILNIVGTFFLSIEAIKIENFIKLIAKIRRPTNSLNPRIEWVDEKSKSDSKGVASFFMVVIAIFSPPVFIVGLLLFPHFNWVYLLFGALFGSFMLWTLTVIFGNLLIKILTYIIAKTPKGTISTTRAPSVAISSAKSRSKTLPLLL